MFTPTRIEVDELLDEHDAPAADVERSLRDLRFINRYFCGIAIYRRLAARFAPTSILDLGTGSSDLLEETPGVRVKIGMDYKIDHLLYERNGSDVLRVVGDARQLPFRSSSVDLVTSSHFFHHFGIDENVAILTDSLRVARRGVAVNDTRRHYAPLLLVRFLGALRLFGRITRFDAPASVRQGYTVSEGKSIASAVPAARWKVQRVWPFRVAILLWKE
jgi:SAM-dependent methyltransferase